MLESIIRVDNITKKQCGLNLIGSPAECAWPEGLTLPTAIVETYSVIDFTSSDNPIYFPFIPLQLLGKEAAIELWKELQSFEDEDAVEFFNSTDDEGKVRSIIYDKRRFPIAYDQLSTSYLFIDGIPGPNGANGQVIYNPTEASFKVLASSISDLFSLVADNLENGSLMFAPLPKEIGTGYHLVTKDGIKANWETIANYNV